MRRRIVLDGSLEIRFDDSVLAVFRQWRQSDRAPEACGILLGMQWPARWEVTEATLPQRTDRRSRLHYVREVPGHLDIAQRRWEESAGLVGYLGEWHTHPQSRAEPSSTDLREAALLSKRNGAMVLSVVVGHRQCTAFLADAGQVLGMAEFDLPYDTASN
jgi:integrative and conjugative element protein (TIGR02256 family)